MSKWIQNSAPWTFEPPPMGAAVEVQLMGEDWTYSGIMIKPRKLWVEIAELDGYIADENSIVRFRVIPDA